MCSCHVNRMQDNLKSGNKSFDSLRELKYLEKILMNQYNNHDYVMSRLKSGNPCCHLVQNFCLLVCYRKKKKKFKHTTLYFCLLFCMGLKFGFSH